MDAARCIRRNRPWLDRLSAFGCVADVRLALLGRYGLQEGSFPDRLYVVGAAETGQTVVQELAKAGVDVLGLYDDDPAKLGMPIAGRRVQPVASLAFADTDVPVVLATHVMQGLRCRLADMGFRHIWPFPLLAHLKSLHCSAHAFYEGMTEALFRGRDQLPGTMDSLADDRSRDVLDAAIGYRLTLDISVYNGLVQPFPYMAEDVVRFTPKEVMVDGGAFEGDTIRDFILRTKGQFKSVIAFEPADRAFAALCRAFRTEPRVHPVQACLYERNATVSFEKSRGRSAAMVESGGCGCPAVAIDGLPNTREITYIKLNVEGAEALALRGAARTIQHNLPSLAVAAYHKPADLWELSALIRSMQPAYKLYFRQHTAGLQETVLYANARG
ncbi:MAG: FkbM family methyltransferase [Phycisphaerae bacterium]|nr:FkbM family methyltransferase [Phycisphaerae bacterium]